jgi:hypothetical protein
MYEDHVPNSLFLMQVEQEFTVWFEYALLESAKTIHLIQGTLL